MRETISEEEVECVARLLRREIQRAAARLIKVRHSRAFSYANEQIEVMNENGDENGDEEDQVFWKRLPPRLRNSSLADGHESGFTRPCYGPAISFI